METCTLGIINPVLPPLVKQRLIEFFHCFCSNLLGSESVCGTQEPNAGNTDYNKQPTCPVPYLTRLPPSTP